MNETKLPPDCSTIAGVIIPGDSTPVDIEVRNGRIAQIVPAAEVPTKALVALPGFVDLHSHLREPGGEEAETIQTGSRAAAAGGYTDVFAMANTNPITDTVDLVDAMRTRAAKASVRVHPVAAATKGIAGKNLVDVRALRAVGVHLFSDDGHCVDDDSRVYELLSILAETGGVFAQHAQSPRIVGEGVINAAVAASVGCPPWPPAGEEAVVARDIALARATGGRLHVCHVSTRGTVDFIRWAKEVGAPVTAEVTPHHLMLTDTDAVRRGPLLKVNPPLRTDEDVTALREALRDGTIDAVGTDHAPHPTESKRRGWIDGAFGMTAIETALPIVADVVTDPHTGIVDWERLVHVMSTVPARIGSLRRASRVEIGEPADLCIVETGGPWTVSAETMLSKSVNTPFDGLTIRHRVIKTMLSGRVTFTAE